VPASGQVAQEYPLPAADGIQWRVSQPLGKWWAGRLRAGVMLPSEGADFFTWDFVEQRAPNRWWRRWGTDRTIRRVLEVVADYRADLPWAPRVGIADISRPRGGPFGRRFGGLGHMSHQNGLDVDIVYPRLDARERESFRPSQVDIALAQELVDRFVADGAHKIWVGHRVRLRGPRKVVAPLVHHENHLHVRFRR
jgi:murein endopeptidase